MIYRVDSAAQRIQSRIRRGQTLFLTIMDNPWRKLDAMILDMLANRKKDRRFSAITVKWLCELARPVLLADETVLDLVGPLCVCGDIHGQYIDLLRAFQLGGIPEGSRYLFLGDYVDRGPQSLDVMCLLLAMKVRYPKHVYMLRGNHESSEMSELFGFKEEIAKKVNDPTIWPIFVDLFRCMPLAAVVGGKFFCVHGGLGPDLNTVDDVRRIERPTRIPQKGLLADILWSDPDAATDEWGPNPRGRGTVLWGARVAKKFLQENGLECIVRGHQVAAAGWSFPFSPEKSVVTVFGASDYDAKGKNDGAMMKINRNGTYQFLVLQPYVPPIGTSVSLDALARPNTAAYRQRAKKAARFVG